MDKKPGLLELYISFFKIGIMTFGGGYAMLPLLEAEVVEKKKWTTKDDILNYYAIGQCTPGIIAVNTATFIGFKERGILGGIVATLGLVSPSLIIIMVIATVLRQFADNEWVDHAFTGVRVAVCALVLKTVISLWKSGVKNKLGIICFLAAFVLVAFFGVSTAWVVIVALIFGVALEFFKRRKKNKEVRS